MSIGSYLGTAPLYEIEKLSGHPPKDAVPFKGYPRQHPYDPDKLIFVFDPLGTAPTIIELKLSDIQYVEDLPSVVKESGEGVPMVKIWVRRGAFGVIHEPFEVQDEIRFINTSKELHDKLMRGLK